MKKKENLPNKISVFPISNFIIFPDMSIPLNIFEPRYLQMVDNSMKNARIIGMIQPKKQNQANPELYNVGCAVKITSFDKTNDGRYLIAINGISRFRILSEINNEKLYRECEVDFNEFSQDINKKNNETSFSDLQLIFKNLKSLFKKKGYIVNWKDLEKQNIDQTINTLSVTSPFSMEEKQILLETINITKRKIELENILNTYIVDDFNNTTIQ